MCSSDLLMLMSVVVPGMVIAVDLRTNSQQHLGCTVIKFFGVMHPIRTFSKFAHTLNPLFCGLLCCFIVLYLKILDFSFFLFLCLKVIVNQVAGGGENYVHGGSSPQEMIVPVLDVRMEKGRMETTTVQLTLVSILKKITNLITALDFMQNEPISDTVRETTFRVYFVGEDNERISNENIVVADKRGETAAERMFRLRFSFKNQKYDNKKPYYLVAYDDKNSVEVLRRQVVMDIAMADDFGFGF